MPSSISRLTYRLAPSGYRLFSVLGHAAEIMRRFGAGAGFMVFWVYIYLGMAALGLSIEAMITILTPRFTPFFLFTLVRIEIICSVVRLLTGIHSA